MKWYVWIRKLVFLYAVVLIGLILMALVPVIEEYGYQTRKFIEKQGTQVFHAYETSYIYDSQGKVLARLKGERDMEYLPFDSIPNEVVKAFVAVEDRNYWNHKGLDGKGLLRVAFQFVKTKGKEVHGASTITQQVARNVFLSHEVTAKRKLKEMWLAIQLEKEYTKQEILEFYINNIYFSNGFYGIESAAKGYFKKSVNKLSLSQIAYLCAIPNNPTYYDPLKQPGNTLERRNKILYDMYVTSQISYQEYKTAFLEKIAVKKQKQQVLNDYQTTYAIDCAARLLMQREGFPFQFSFKSKKEYEEYQEQYKKAYEKQKENLYGGGYLIRTSLDSDIQNKVQTALNDTLSFEKTKNEKGIYKLQGAATCIDNQSGKVVAIIGGRKQKLNTYSFNRAYQGYRQPGSVIKPLLVYGPALEKGYEKDSVLEDRKEENGPKNADGIYLGQVTLKAAIEQSRNAAAWSLYQEISPAYGLSYLEKMQFSKLTPTDVKSMAACLGGFEYGTTTEEMAGAYTAFVREGTYMNPDCLVSVIDKNGKELYQSKEETVYQKKTADTMIQLLKGVMTDGTGKFIDWKRKTAAIGKTGTTNENKDGWFCGSTPYYTLAVWVGYDMPETLKGLSGATYPAKIWKKAMEACIEGKAEKDFKE